MWVPYHRFPEKDWRVPNRDGQTSKELTSAHTPKKCDPRTKTEQKMAEREGQGRTFQILEKSEAELRLL